MNGPQNNWTAIVVGTELPEDSLVVRGLVGFLRKVPFLNAVIVGQVSDEETEVVSGVEQ